MKRFLFAALAATLTILSVTVLTGLAVPSRSLQQEGSGPGGLTRIPPIGQGPDGARSGARAADFDGERWSERLGAEDLDQREAAFDAIVELAAADPAARDWLHEQAAGADRELAWTARLALREAAASARPGAGPTPAPFGAPFGSTIHGDLFHRMQELENELDAMLGGSPFPAPLGGLGLGHPPATLPPGATQSQSGFRMESGPDGVRITVTENVDGQATERTYEGDSLEEILEQNPELRDRIGVGGGLGLQMGPGVPGLHGSPFRSWFDANVHPTPPQAVNRTDILGVVIRELDDAERDSRGLPAGAVLHVERVEPGTIASAIGLTPGDTLLELNGSPVELREDIASALELRPATGEVTVAWIDGLGRRQERSWKPAEQQDLRK